MGGPSCCALPRQSRERLAKGGRSGLWFAVAGPLVTIASQQAGPGFLGDGNIELHARVGHRQPLGVDPADQLTHGLGCGEGDGMAGAALLVVFLSGRWMERGRLDGGCGVPRGVSSAPTISCKTLP